MKKKHFAYEMAIFIANILTLITEVYLFSALIHDTLSLQGYLIAHFSLIFFSLALALGAWRAKLNLNYPLLCLIFITFLGPFGGIIGIISLLLFIIYKPFTPELEDLIETLAPDVSLSLSERVYQRINSEVIVRNSNEPPINYQDIITLGTTKQKQIAIAKMLKYFDPEFAPILFTAIDDPVSAIRVLAATALNSIDQGFAKGRAKQEEEIKLNPLKPLEVKKLALICDKYANSGILEKERKEKVTQAAIEAYEKYLTMVKQDSDATNALAKIFIRERRLKEAKLLLKEIIEDHSKVDSLSLLNYAEILYEMRDFSSLKKALGKEIKDQNEHSQEYQAVEELKEVWLN